MNKKYYLARIFTVAVTLGIAGAASAQQSTQQSSLPGAHSRIGNLFSAPKDDELLEPERAFKLQISAAGTNTVVAELMPAPGYYIYKDKVKFAIKDQSGVVIRSVKLPAGEMKTDLTFGKTEVYKRPIRIELGLDRAAGVKSVTLLASYQGCQEKIGVCYPPIEKSITVTLP